MGIGILIPVAMASKCRDRSSDLSEADRPKGLSLRP